MSTHARRRRAAAAGTPHPTLPYPSHPTRYGSLTSLSLSRHQDVEEAVRSMEVAYY